MNMGMSDDLKGVALHMPGANDVPPSVVAAAGSRTTIPNSLAGRLLYVEDNVRIAEITEIMLEDLGLNVKWAVCAEDALKLLDETEDGFDLVLTDVVMPGMSGVELAKRIGQLFPKLPIILTSGFSEELALGYGSEYQLLPKPFTRMALIQCLQRYLDPLAS